MTTLVDSQKEIFLRGKDRNFTGEEFDELSQRLLVAYQSGDMDEFYRLGKLLPIAPEVAKAVKEVYGKEELLSRGYDLTEANLRFGEGWLDFPEEK